MELKPLNLGALVLPVLQLLLSYMKALLKTLQSLFSDPKTKAIPVAKVVYSEISIVGRYRVYEFFANK